MITVLVPTFNCVDRIGRTIASFGGRDDVQIVFSDNASTDGTHELLLEFARTRSGVQVHRMAANAGRIGNWNRCLELAELAGARAVLFLMAGDALSDGFKQPDGLAAPSARDVFVFAPIEIATSAGVTVARRAGNAASLRHSADVLDTLFRRGIPFLGPLQANVLKTADGRFPRFREDVDGYYADQYMLVEFLKRGCDVIALDRPLTRFSQDLSRTHGSKSLATRVAGDLRFVADAYLGVKGAPPSTARRGWWAVLNWLRYSRGALRGYA